MKQEREIEGTRVYFTQNDPFNPSLLLARNLSENNTDISLNTVEDTNIIEIRAIPDIAMVIDRIKDTPEFKALSSSFNFLTPTPPNLDQIQTWNSRIKRQVRAFFWEQKRKYVELASKEYAELGDTSRAQDMNTRAKQMKQQRDETLGYLPKLKPDQVEDLLEELVSRQNLKK